MRDDETKLDTKTRSAMLMKMKKKNLSCSIY